MKLKTIECLALEPLVQQAFYPCVAAIRCRMRTLRAINAALQYDQEKQQAVTSSESGVPANPRASALGASWTMLPSDESSGGC